MDRNKVVKGVFGMEGVPDLDAWLSSHQGVRDALAWEGAFGSASYQDWSASDRLKLFRAFARAWRGESSGLQDPLPNQSSSRFWLSQTLSKKDAKSLYMAYAANSLAVEIGERVPWSVLEYSDKELAVLFDSRQLSKRKLFGGYGIKNDPHGYSLPSPPEIAAAFMADKIGPDRLATIVNLLEWCRGMAHFLGGYTADNAEVHWGYRGFMPASRIIEGTVNTAKPQMGTRHWTGGCHGTSGFLRSVLRAVNIPVAHVFNANHSLTHFVTEGAYLTHGDDPYSAWFKSTGASASALLISEARYRELFVDVDENQEKLNVGIRPREIAIEHLSEYLLKQYCKDVKDGLSHEDGRVNRGLRNWSVQELEAMGLWGRMDAKISELFGRMPKNCETMRPSITSPSRFTP